MVSISGFCERDKYPHLGKMENNGRNVVKCGRNISNKIHGNGLPNVRRNMERLINVNFMIDRFSMTARCMMDEVLYKFVQGWPTKVAL